MKLIASAGGQRADKFLAGAFPGRGRRLIARAFEQGAVKINGRRGRKGDLLAAGDAVEVDDAALPEAAGLAPVAEARDLEVLWEDAWLVALAKPAGMASHPLRPGERGTLANAIVARWPECASVGEDPREAGLAHRLDGGTSGAIVAARDEATWRALRAAFGEGRVDKTYLALVAGSAERGESDAPIKGQAAHTEWEPVERFPGFTLLRCAARTGRMHQVRVHLAGAGTPVVGDTRYGGSATEGRGPAEPALVGHFLHAERLRLTHPATGAPLDLRAPLPADRQTLLALLRAGA